MKTLTIISGPDQAVFDQIVNHDDASSTVTFSTKEKGDIVCECSGIDIIPGAEFDIYCRFNNGKVEYNSKRQSGILFIVE